METQIQLQKLEMLSKAALGRSLVLGIFLVGGTLLLKDFSVTSIVYLYGLVLLIKWVFAKKEKYFVELHLIIANKVALILLTIAGLADLGVFDGIIGTMFLFLAFMMTRNIEAEQPNSKTIIQKAILRTVITWPIMVGIAILVQKFV